MTAFIVERMDPGSGHRESLPFRFHRQEEAAAMAAELTLSDPQYAYIVKFVAAA
jgi:hypothetical protein